MKQVEFDTVEAGAGSYPEPPSTNKKLFVFKLACTCMAEAEVQAENRDKAEEILKSASQYDLKYEHYIDFNDIQIEEIKSCEVLELD